MRDLALPKQKAPPFMGKTGQAVVSLHSATLFLGQGCQEVLSATKAANPNPSLTGDSIGENGSQISAV